MSSSVPRRSARLAAKKVHAIHAEQSPEIKDARRRFLAGLHFLAGVQIRSKCPCDIPCDTPYDTPYDTVAARYTIQSYLDDVEKAHGPNEKAKITIDLYTYLIEVPFMMAVYPRFMQSVNMKTEELLTVTHKITDPVIQRDFIQTLKNVQYILSSMD